MIPGQQQKDEIAIVKEQHKHIRLRERLLPQKGQKLWEFNMKTMDIKVVDHSTTTYNMVTKKTRNKVIKKKNCLYCLAINEDNAFKKFEKEVKSLIAQGTVLEALK